MAGTTSDCAVSSTSMAALYARKRRARLGEVPLSAGEVEYLRRKDEAARRQQRLLEVRSQEKRVAQLVTQRYRDNLRRLHAHKLHSAQQAHRAQQDALLSELHDRYQHSLQHAGTAQRNARAMLAELVEAAHTEQRKWNYNDAHVAKARSSDAARVHDSEREAIVARRHDIEANLQRLKEASVKQRAQASIRARREQEKLLELAQRQAEAEAFRRRNAKYEEVTLARPRGKDVDAYQFTRSHCIAAPSVPATARTPQPEVKVIRHNRKHPSAASGIDDAAAYRDEMDKKRERDRRTHEAQTERAEERGDHALEHVRSTQDGARAFAWLQQIDDAQRSADVFANAREQPLTRATASGRGEGEQDAEAAFLRLFAVADDELLELSTHSVQTQEANVPAVERIAMSPLVSTRSYCDSVDPADDSDASAVESITMRLDASREDDDKADAAAASDWYHTSVDRERRSAESNRHRRVDQATGLQHSLAETNAGLAAAAAMRMPQGPKTHHDQDSRAQRTVDDTDAVRSRRGDDEASSVSERTQRLGTRGSEMKPHGRHNVVSRDDSHPRRLSIESELSGAFGDDEFETNELRAVRLERNDLDDDLQQRRASLDALESRLQDVLDFRTKQTQMRREQRARPATPGTRPSDRMEQIARDVPLESEHESSVSDATQRRLERSRASATESAHAQYAAHGNDRQSMNQEPALSVASVSSSDSDGSFSTRASHVSRQQLERHPASGNSSRRSRAVSQDAHVEQRDDALAHSSIDSDEDAHDEGESVRLSGGRASDRLSTRRSVTSSPASSVSSSSRSGSSVSSQPSRRSHGDARRSTQAMAVDQQTPVAHDAMAARGVQRPSRLQQQQQTVSLLSPSRRSDVFAVASTSSAIQGDDEQYDEDGDEDVSDARSDASAVRSTRSDVAELPRSSLKTTTPGSYSATPSAPLSPRVSNADGLAPQLRPGAAPVDALAQSRSERSASAADSMDRVRTEDAIDSSYDEVQDSVRRFDKAQVEAGSRSSLSSGSSRQSHSPAIALPAHRSSQSSQSPSSSSSSSSFSSSAASSSRQRAPHIDSRVSVPHDDDDLDGNDEVEDRLESSAHLTASRVSRESARDSTRALRSRIEPNKTESSGVESNDERRLSMPSSDASLDQHHDRHTASAVQSDRRLDAPRDLRVPGASDITREQHDMDALAAPSTAPAPRSDRSDSFDDDSLDLSSAHVGAGDRGQLYLQKIHERLQHFAGRDSAASSIAQYSLPLSDSQSSVSESFGDSMVRWSQSRGGADNDSFLHQLVPMFSASGTRQATGASDSVDRDARAGGSSSSFVHLEQQQYDVQLVTPSLRRMTSDSVRSRADEQRTLEEATSPLQESAPAMEQYSLLSDSDSGMSSVGFSAVLHLTSGVTRQRTSGDRDEQRRLSDSAEAHFQHLVRMRTAVEQALPLHLPAMAHGPLDMRLPPAPLHWGSASSSSSSSRTSQGVNSVHETPAPAPDQVGSLDRSEDGNDQFATREQLQDARRLDASHASATSGLASHDDDDDDDDELAYESFRRGLAARAFAPPPLPFGDVDMTRPPAPLILAHSDDSLQSSRSQSSSRSRETHARQSERSPRDDTDDEQKRDESSVHSSRLSSSSSSSERATGPSVSLADAFRQRHPRFQQRVDAHRAEQRRKRDAQQQQRLDYERARPTAVTTTDASGSDLTPEQQQLLGRLAVGERAQVSPHEMRVRTQRLYQKLPEVVERKRQDELLRRRKERLAALREQEKVRRYGSYSGDR